MEVKINRFLEDFSEDKKPLGFYLLGSMVVLIFSIIGQIPMFFFIPNEISTYSEGLDVFSSLDKNLLLLLLLLPSAFSFLGLWFVVKQIHFRSLISIITSRINIDFKRFGFAFILWSIISVSIFIIEILISPTDYEWNFNFSKFLVLFFISFIMIPIQSIVEELIFRGYLMQAFGILFKNRWIPLIFTAGIFGILHLWNPEIDKLGTELIWYYIGTGLFLGIITLMDDGIELALGFHAANNLVTAILVTASWTAFQTESILIDNSEPSLGKELFITLLIIYPILTIIFAKKYQWKNWKKQLLNSFG